MARKALTEEELDRYNEHYERAIKGESDLGCALIVTAFIENSLMTLLRKFLIEGATSENMFKAGGSLGDSAKCADMAYSLGLIDKTMLKTLKAVGDIRNIFAHSPELLDFNHVNVKAQVCDLTLSQGLVTMLKKHMGASELTTTMNPNKTPREWFCFVCRWVAFYLMGVTMFVERRPKKSEFGSEDRADEQL